MRRRRYDAYLGADDELDPYDDPAEDAFPPEETGELPLWVVLAGLGAFIWWRSKGRRR